MSMRESSCRVTRVSWLASVSVVTVLAALAIVLMPGSRQTHAGVNRPQGTNSVLAPLGAPAQKLALAVNYGTLPLSFEMNQGQSGQSVDFISRGRGYTMFLAGNEAVLSLRSPRQGATRRSKIENRDWQGESRVASPKSPTSSA